MMEENKVMVADVTTIPEYPSAAYGEYTTVNPDGSTSSSGNTGEHVHSNSQEITVNAADDSHYTDASAYNSVSTSTAEEVSVDAAYHAALLAPSCDNASGYEINGNIYTNEVASTSPREIADNGSIPSVTGAPTDHQFGDISEMSGEEARLWGLVRANCLDFNAWTSLIQETEKENNILKIRKVYDAFLAEFPLCFGYWKKYADHEGRLDTMDKVVEVYERAVLAVTYSVDIWVHYCQFAISTHGEPENIRRLFERGLAYVGTDYLSYPLWDEYINYEYTLQEWSRVAILYTRILECPIQQLDRYFASFKEFAASRPLSDIRTPEESLVGTNVGMISEESEQEVQTDDVEQAHKPVSEGLTEAEDLQKYIAIREEIYKKTKEFESKIITFETAIRRPYFHVKPLDDPELENWHNYLDYIEKGDDFNKVVKLYERCLIACANYPEFWIRYVLCMEVSGSMELACNALARATQVFVKKQPDIHLFAARFKEVNGDVLGARAEYHQLYSEFSTALMEAAVRHANMEHRLGNKELAYSVFEEAIAAELGREFSNVLPLMFVQYSRFSFLVAGDAEKAREIFTGALERLHLCKPLLEAAIHLESIIPLPKRIEYLDSLVEKFITPIPDNPHVASAADREDISCIFLEFLDIFGDAQAIKKADNRHSILFLRQRGSAMSSRKRRADEYLGSDKTKMSKTYTQDPSSGQAAMGAYPNTQTQWPAAYNQQPSAWPQAAQTAGQQWNPGYAPQAGYNSYGGYGGYPTNVQMPASAPQSTAYAAYPATSSVQTYPPQSYAQPAPAYTQQQAPVGQASYYGSYY